MAVYAIHYVKVAGHTYMPGDLIRYDLPAVDRAYLLEKGAIRVDETDVNPADENGPEIVFESVDETDVSEPAMPNELDALDGIVAPAKKKATRKKG